MTRYLSMLKTDILQFVATQCYDTLIKLQEAARQRELEIELQLWEQRHALVQLQPATKRPMTADSKSEGQRGCTCGKCGKGHLGVCRLTSTCLKCDKDGHFARDCCHPAPVEDMRICYHCDQVGHMKTNYP